MSQPVPSSPPATPNADAGGSCPRAAARVGGGARQTRVLGGARAGDAGQALALYGAGVASRRIAAPELTWPVDLNFAQGPVGWLLVACLLIAGRRAARDAIAAGSAWCWVWPASLATS